MFALHPELFAAKARAQEALEEAGFHWIADYAGVDPLHEENGLEVEGLSDQATARQILAVLQRAFPDWPLADIFYRDYADARWCVSLCKMRRACG